MPYQANDQDTCLFCLGEAEPLQPLQKNKKCDCKYTYHDACYARYDRKDVCPLCKQHKGYQILPPSAPLQHYTITVTFPGAEQQQDYIPVPVEPQPQQHRKLTLWHIICLLLIIVGVIGMIVGVIMFYN